MLLCTLSGLTDSDIRPARYQITSQWILEEHNMATQSEYQAIPSHLGTRACSVSSPHACCWSQSPPAGQTHFAPHTATDSCYFPAGEFALFKSFKRLKTDGTKRPLKAHTDGAVLSLFLKPAGSIRLDNVIWWISLLKDKSPISSLVRFDV